jgi:hypothetical protein
MLFEAEDECESRQMLKRCGTSTFERVQKTEEIYHFWRAAPARHELFERGAFSVR